LFSRCADQRETRLPGSDEAVQPSDAVGDVPSRVRRLVRWKKVRWRKLIADHLSLAVPIGEIVASARLTPKRVGPQMAPQRPERLIPRPGMVWPGRPGPTRSGARAWRGALSDRPAASAPKWRRKGMKTLVSRPEMVWPVAPRTYKIWHPGAAECFIRTGAARPSKSCRFWRLTH
jgi:hypothetical protein